MPALKPLKLVAVGQSLIKRDVSDCPVAAFQKLVRLIRAADVALTNYEGTIGGECIGWPTKNIPPHASDPLVLDALRFIGFNALSLANNHAFDLGPAGILATLAAAKERGFLHAGIGADWTGAGEPGYLETDKGMVALAAMDASPQPDYAYAQDAGSGRMQRPGINRQRIVETLRLGPEDFEAFTRISRRAGYVERKTAFIDLGFRMHLKNMQDLYGLRYAGGDRTEMHCSPDPEDLARNLASIRATSRRAGFTIAYLHHHYWNDIWNVPPDWIREFARRCIEAGANVFVSHGVPLLQGVEVYRRRPIFYSLGNFIFHSLRKSTYKNDAIWQSVAAACEFDSDGNMICAEFTPIVLGGDAALRDHSLSRDIPQVAGAETGRRILQHFADLSRQFKSKIEIKAGRALLPA